jgi:hypothetical protein
MKKNKILSGVAAITALCGVTALAQINYQNGDMLAAFGNGGSVDVVVDLGAISNFQQPNATGLVSFTGVGTALQSVFGSNLTGVYWSVFGVNDTTIANNTSVSQTDSYTIWNTLARSNPNNQTTAPFVAGSSAVQQLPALDIETIASLTGPSAAGPGQIVNLSQNIVSVKTSLGGYSSMMNDPYSGNLQGDWTYNIQNVGPGVSDLYQSNPGNRYTQKATYLGDFSLDSSGALTFSPVPEPSTWAMLGGGLICLIGLFRLKNRD